MAVTVHEYRLLQLKKNTNLLKWNEFVAFLVCLCTNTSVIPAVRLSK